MKSSNTTGEVRLFLKDMRLEGGKIYCSRCYSSQSSTGGSGGICVLAPGEHLSFILETSDGSLEKTVKNDNGRASVSKMSSVMETPQGSLDMTAHYLNDHPIVVSGKFLETTIRIHETASPDLPCTWWQCFCHFWADWYRRLKVQLLGKNDGSYPARELWRG